MRRRERIGGTAIQWPRLFRTRAARRHLRLTAGNRPTFQPADARCGTLGALDENRWRRPSSRISLPGFNEAAAMAAEKPATATTPPPARAGFNEAAAKAAEKPAVPGSRSRRDSPRTLASAAHFRRASDGHVTHFIGQNQSNRHGNKALYSASALPAVSEHRSARASPAKSPDDLTVHARWSVPPVRQRSLRVRPGGTPSPG